MGDMVGSLYEFHPIKSKDFNIYNHKMRMTDDSYLTIAVAKTLLKHYPIDYSKESLERILCFSLMKFSISIKSSKQ